MLQIIGVVIGFPRELASIVADYAKEIPHTWKNLPVADRSVSIDGTVVRSFGRKGTDRGSKRIVSTQTVVDGPQRWKIRMSWQEEHSYIAVGATVSTGSGRMNWINDSDDVLIEAAVSPLLNAANRPSTIIYDDLDANNIKIRSDNQSHNTRFPKRCKSTVTFGFELDSIRRKLFVFDLDDDDCQMVVDLADVGRIWRPCVVVSGNVSASILAWRPSSFL